MPCSSLGWVRIRMITRRCFHTVRELGDQALPGAAVFELLLDPGVPVEGVRRGAHRHPSWTTGPDVGHGSIWSRLDRRNNSGTAIPIR